MSNLFVRKHRLAILVALLCTSVSFIMAIGVYTWTVVANPTRAPSIGASKIEDTETNFLWQAMVLNSTVQNGNFTSAEKSTKLEIIAKNNIEIISNLSHTLNKYSVLFGSDWYNQKSRTFSQFSTSDYKNLILLTPNLTAYRTDLVDDITVELKNREIMQGDTKFMQFDAYKLALDANYVDFSKSFFETEIPTTTLYNPEFDMVVHSIATVRGFDYKKQVNPSELVQADDGWTFKKGVREEYDLMAAQALKDGVVFELISAYRSPSEQKKLFDEEMQKFGVSLPLLKDKAYLHSDDFQNRVTNALNRVAPPFYSRHHTGITFDLVSPESRVFSDTTAFTWLSANNYYNAKRFGFMPSYPKLQESAQYGPNEESWEYFYTGVDNTRDL